MGSSELRGWGYILIVILSNSICARRKPKREQGSLQGSCGVHDHERCCGKHMRKGKDILNLEEVCASGSSTASAFVYLIGKTEIAGKKITGIILIV